MIEKDSIKEGVFEDGLGGNVHDDLKEEGNRDR